MAKLGDAFSDEQRRESARRQLRPGTIIYLEVVFPEGPRSKYLVVAHVKDSWTGNRNAMPPSSTPTRRRSAARAAGCIFFAACGLA